MLYYSYGIASWYTILYYTILQYHMLVWYITIICYNNYITLYSTAPGRTSSGLPGVSCPPRPLIISIIIVSHINVITTSTTNHNDNSNSNSNNNISISCISCISLIRLLLIITNCYYSLRDHRLVPPCPVSSVDYQLY